MVADPTECKPSLDIAETLANLASKLVRQAYEQREEILKAFIAKHGHDPDDVIQCYNVQTGNFFVREMTKSEKAARDFGREKAAVPI